MNDASRRLWILNDEGLYGLWRASGLPLHKYISTNRKKLDALIEPMVSGLSRPHHLAYGHKGK